MLSACLPLEHRLKRSSMDNRLVVDISLHWAAVVIYACASLANTFGVIFEKERFRKAGYTLAFLGLLVHGSALIYRWQYAGHGPYMTRYEILSSNAWIVMLMFLVFARYFTRIRPTSIIVFPSVFLLVAIGNFMNPDVQMLPPTLRSIWLVIHVLFYKIALNAMLIALAFSILLMFRKRKSIRWMQKLPDMHVMDLYAYRFAGFGFVFWAIATLAGSIWAYQSWGRFWGWDPIETWSLIAWILFGIYLHLRRFYQWKGEKAAVLYIICFLVALVAIFFTPLIESSIHSEYFK